MVPLICGAILAALPLGSTAITAELFTTNAVCKQRGCINPIFPGLQYLQDFSSKRWLKRPRSQVAEFMDFCGQFVDYDPALPMPNRSDQFRYATDDIQESAIEADRSASILYFYHLSGMGIEPWDHTDPATGTGSKCASSVAKLACYTHFPQAYGTGPDGAEVSYLRPCATACQDYLSTCEVECCDESVSCTSVSSPSASGSPSLLQQGYVDGKPGQGVCTASGELVA